MGFLDKMWDETLAGPAPEKGLGRLRKHKSLSAVRSPSTPIAIPRCTDHHHPRDGDGDGDLDQTAGISRSITILRTKNLSVETGSGASSPPSTSSGPSSPFSPGEMGKDPKVRRFARRIPTDHAEETSPSVYDWIMISALDR